MPEGTIRPPVPGTKPPTPLPTSPPTPSPTPFPNLSYTLKIKCFIKDDTTGDFDIPCEDVDFTKFSAGELNRDILLRYTIDNKSNEPLDVSSLITSIADESEATLISPAADMIVPKQSEKDCKREKQRNIRPEEDGEKSDQPRPLITRSIRSPF